MKLIGRRAWILLIICVLFFAGMLFFLVSYAVNAPTWAVSSMNSHIFVDGKLANVGTITDKNDAVLAHSEEGTRVYSEEKAIRTSLMHLIGEETGSVSTSLQVAYLNKLSGWNYFSGLYSPGDSIGNNIKTTIDQDVSRVAYSALDGRKGTVGIMNYKTGDIICMVSSTSFDPSNPPDVAANPEKYDGVFMNRLLSASYTPGSIFKLVTANAAMNEIPDVLSRRFFCDGSKTIDGKKITCTYAHGEQTFTEAMVHSCNVAFAEMALEVTPATLTKYAKDAGLNTSLKVGQIKVATGSFDLSNAQAIDVGWAGAGQYETLINPLSFLQYVASIANDGKTVSPKIIDSIKTEQGLPASINISLPKGKSMDKETAQALQRIMRACVTENYGEGGLGGYNMSAKTGTAEVGDNKEPHSWYCGFLDSESAPFAFIVLVENGGYGSSAAFDVATTVLQELVD